MQHAAATGAVALTLLSIAILRRAHRQATYSSFWKGKEGIRTRIDQIEVGTIAAAGIVFLGLIGEVVGFPATAEGQISISAAVVAFGVLLEFLLHIRLWHATHLLDEINRAEEARHVAEVTALKMQTERLTERNEILQQILRPRSVSIAGLSENPLRFAKGTPFAIDTVPDVEALGLARNVWFVLFHAGWEGTPPSVEEFTDELSIAGGVSILGEAEFPEAVRALREFLTDHGVYNGLGLNWGRDSEKGKGVVRIRIGSKPSGTQLDELGRLERPDLLTWLSKEERDRLERAFGLRVRAPGTT